MEKLLAVFEIKDRKFSVYGDYQIIKEPYHYHKFCYKPIAKEIVNKTEINYTPGSVSLGGIKRTASDMIDDLILHLILDTKIYKSIFLDSGLQRLVDFYKEDNIKIVNGLNVPKKILIGEQGELFELKLVTNEFIYYSYDDEFLMVRTDTHSIVSNNDFAAIGFFGSVESIKNGTEELIWES